MKNTSLRYRKTVQLQAGELSCSIFNLAKFEAVEHFITQRRSCNSQIQAKKRQKKLSKINTKNERKKTKRRKTLRGSGIEHLTPRLEINIPSVCAMITSQFSNNSRPKKNNQDMMMQQKKKLGVQLQLEVTT